MKNLAILIVALAGFQVHASNNLNEFKCASSTISGTVVTVKGCYQLNEDGELNSAKVSSCKPGQAAAIGIQAKSKSGQIKQQLIPTEVIRLQGTESFQVFTIENSTFGKLELYLATDGFNRDDNKLLINVPNMNYSFKAVGCRFRYLGEIK